MKLPSMTARIPLHARTARGHAARGRAAPRGLRPQFLPDNFYPCLKEKLGERFNHNGFIYDLLHNCGDDRDCWLADASTLDFRDNKAFAGAAIKGCWTV